MFNHGNNCKTYIKFNIKDKLLHNKNIYLKIILNSCVFSATASLPPQVGWNNQSHASEMINANSQLHAANVDFKIMRGRKQG